MFILIKYLQPAVEALSEREAQLALRNEIGNGNIDDFVDTDFDGEGIFFAYFAIRVFLYLCDLLTKRINEQILNSH